MSWRMGETEVNREVGRSLWPGGWAESEKLREGEASSPVGEKS